MSVFGQISVLLVIYGALELLSQLRLEYVFDQSINLF